MKIAVIQNKWGDEHESALVVLIERVEGILKKEQIDFLLLPEFFYGPPWFQPGQSRKKGVTDDTIPGKISDRFCLLAKKYNVNIIMGTIIERRADKYYNTSAFIARNGEIKKKINKMHTFAGESVACEENKKIETIETEFGDIGIAVCSDFWVLEYMKILTLKGAKVVFIPGGTLGQNTEQMVEALKAISYLTSTIIVYASPIGNITGKRGDSEVRLKYTGNSMIISPERIIQMGSSSEEEILTATFHDSYIDQYRQEKGSFIWKRFQKQDQSSLIDILENYIYKDRELTDLMKERMQFDDVKRA